MASTITEALAELKMIDKRIEKKREFVSSYLMRHEMVRDPHEKDGGSVTAVARELQAIHDLEERKVRVRRRINEANLQTMLVNGATRSIAEWLIWRREVATSIGTFYDGLSNRIAQTRKEAVTKGVAVVSTGDSPKPMDIVVNLNEQDLARWREEHAALLETLDGQLSLKNATTLVETD